MTQTGHSTQLRVGEQDDGTLLVQRDPSDPLLIGEDQYTAERQARVKALDGRPFVATPPPVPHREACYIIPDLLRYAQHTFYCPANKYGSSACDCDVDKLKDEAEAWSRDITKDIEGSQPPWERGETS